MLTPCPTATTTGCGGLFPLEFLLTQQHAADVPCQECGRRYQVAELLTGLRQSSTGPATGTADEALREALDIGLASLRRDIRDLQHDLHAAAAANADAMRRLLTVVSTEVPDCPRLFTLVRAPAKGIAKMDPRLQHFRLTLWCEEPGHWHPHTAGSYPIERSAEWFRQVARYARPVLAILRAVVPVAGPLAGIVFTKDQADQAKKELDLTQALLDDLPALRGDDTDWADGPDGAAVPAAAAGASLRGLRQLLNDDVDRSRRYGGLARFLTPAGDYVWVCPAHAAAYNPGLPAT
jgi:internalin A